MSPVWCQWYVRTTRSVNVKTKMEGNNYIIVYHSYLNQTSWFLSIIRMEISYKNTSHVANVFQILIFYPPNSLNPSPSTSWIMAALTLAGILWVKIGRICITLLLPLDVEDRSTLLPLPNAADFSNGVPGWGDTSVEKTWCCGCVVGVHGVVAVFRWSDSSQLSRPEVRFVAVFPLPVDVCVVAAGLVDVPTMQVLSYRWINPSSLKKYLILAKVCCLWKLGHA